MSIELALALLSVSAPITAAIIKLAPPLCGRKPDPADAAGPYLTTREFDLFRAEFLDTMRGVKTELHQLAQARS
jgi:hypothetical protein